MNAVKTSITITGLTRSYGDRDWFHDNEGKRFAYMIRDEGGISADIEVKAEMDGEEFTVYIDLPIDCPQLEQIESALIQATKGVRRVARERQAPRPFTVDQPEWEVGRAFLWFDGHEIECGSLGSLQAVTLADRLNELWVERSSREKDESAKPLDKPTEKAYNESG